MRIQTPEGREFVYHYTNAAGLIGIVNSKKLWATKIQYLDDRSELNHAFSVAKSVAYKIKKESDNELIKMLLDKIPEDFERVERVNIFVFSFSYACDLLSQWRAYSSDGGYALGFDPHVIEKLAYGQGFKFERCVYDEKEQENVVERILKNYLSSFLNRSKVAKNGEEVNKLIKDISWQVVVNLTSVSPTFKHPSFAEEKEWRLISELKRSGDKAINCRNKRDLVVPYFEFDLENDGIKFRIEEIMIGPGLPRDLAMDSVGILLARIPHGLGYTSHTSIPYKKWNHL